MTIGYRKVYPDGTPPENFEFYLGGKLALDNRWVMVGKLIPWSEFEAEYAQNFAKSMGVRVKSFRVALGALIIKKKLGTSDFAKANASPTGNSRTDQREPIPAILYRSIVLQQLNPI